MSQQTTLTNYFKSSALPVPTSNKNSKDKKLKRRSLSLKKTPVAGTSKTTSKEETVLKNPEPFILLSSDSEFEQTPPKKQNTQLYNNSDDDLFTPDETLVSFKTPNCSSDGSNASVTIFEYNLSPGSILKPPETPPKISPGKNSKFYSPTKKRLLKNKSPVKRNLGKEFTEHFAPDCFEEKHFSWNNVEKDDKATFLLKIIVEYLNTEGLKKLLEEDSQVLLENCLHVKNPGMKLMCRLYWRQHGWYCLDDIRHIATGKMGNLSSPDFYEMIGCLVEYGLITSAESEGETKMDFDDYVKLLKRPDLLEICKELKLKMQSKQDAVEALRLFSKLAPISNFYSSNKGNNHTRVLQMLKSKTGNCYKISDLARTTFYNLYVLMYLGIDYSIIRDKKLELILIYDKICRETYPIDKDMVVDNASVVFQDREEFYRYLQAHMIYEEYLEMGDTNEKCEIVKKSYSLYKGVEEEHIFRYQSLPPWLRRFTPPNIYVKMLESGVQELKKLKTVECYKFAVEILDTLINQVSFRQHKKAEWYAEKALILHSHLDSAEKAAQVLLEGFKSNLPELTKESMRPRALKIANQRSKDLKEELRLELREHATKEAILEKDLPAEHIYKLPMDNYNQRGKLKFETHIDNRRSTLTAEDYCISHYLLNKDDVQYIQGEHWEGRIVTTLFFLLFWDIIYTNPVGIKGIFLNHFQRYPLDMFCESFYINRKALIETRLKFIEDCTEQCLIEFIQSNWGERPEYEISDIQRSIGWDNVKDVASCLQPRGVATICRRLATNYGYARSGFPDLTLWNSYTKKIKFVEVKTDADKPSVKQLQWIQYLLVHNIDAGFCYVGANTTRSRARSSANFSQSQ